MSTSSVPITEYGQAIADLVRNHECLTIGKFIEHFRVAYRSQLIEMGYTEEGADAELTEVIPTGTEDIGETVHLIEVALFGYMTRFDIAALFADILEELEEDAGLEPSS